MKLTASSVSRRLAKRFKRGTRLCAGFDVFQNHQITNVDSVKVRYVNKSGMTHMHSHSHIIEYAKYLSRHYKVTSYGNHLVVTREGTV